MSHLDGARRQRLDVEPGRQHEVVGQRRDVEAARRDGEGQAGRADGAAGGAGVLDHAHHGLKRWRGGLGILDRQRPSSRCNSDGWIQQ